MSSTEVINDLEEMVQQMTKQSGIDKYTIDIEGKTDCADGYLGDILFFSVTEMGDKRSYFVLKTCKRNKIFREVLCAEAVYARELCLYSNIFPTLESFLKEKFMDGFLDFVPKARFTYNIPYRESIILENLKHQDFRLCQRSSTLNLEHIKLVFETYGKWHGLTMAYRDQCPEKFATLTKNWVDTKVLLWKKFGIYDDFKREFLVTIEMFKDCGRNDLVNIYRKLEPHIDSLLSNTGKDDDILCIIHGDCWVNNYMFRYEQLENAKPCEVRFLDFQMALVDSPVLDLSSFFYNVADKNSLNNLDYLLTIYHESLSKTMKNLGSNQEKIFSMSDLKQHWKKYGFYAVLALAVYMKVQLCDPDEAPDFIELIENGQSFDGTFAFESRNMERIRERIKERYIHFGELLKFKKL
ncbi:hypothetical protein HHI36_015196 [Cryptolaemus montrouzieri]|uniref:CHK kinase-like domain-containing protein n=1 Tax=Cryptolaemus montrouzieri TaxID=559131 RepID=A0ABD2N648_9CUCU